MLVTTQGDSRSASRAVIFGVVAFAHAWLSRGSEEIDVADQRDSQVGDGESTLDGNADMSGGKVVWRVDSMCVVKLDMEVGYMSARRAEGK